MMRKVTAVLIAVILAALLPVARGWSRDRIPFPHATHLAADLACDDCHKGVPDSKNLAPGIGYDETKCAGCHDAADLTKWGYPAPLREMHIKDFSHNDHLAMGKKCEDCHGALADPELAGTGKGVPGHAVCFECHDNVTKNNDCAFCHTAFTQGRLTALDRDPEAMKPMDHHPGFIHDHQFRARLDGSGCVDCHRSADFCSTCHQGENVEFLIHPRNWRYDHPVAARKNFPDCSACHDRGTFCTECHMSEGVRPENHGDRGTGFRDVWRNHEHAIQARRDVAVCAGCHDADNLFLCKFCHSVPGGKNPHGPDFRSNAGHGYWHDECQTKVGACYDCHRDDPVFCTRCHERRDCGGD